MAPKLSLYIDKSALSGTVSDFENRDKTKKELLNDILERNSFLKSVNLKEDDLKIVYISSTADNLQLHVIIKLSADLRELIRTNYNVLYCGLGRHRVKEWYHIIQCFKCQRIGHTSDTCKSLHSICMYCTGNHASKSCNHKNDKSLRKCSNCCSSLNGDIKKNASTHIAADFKCPIIQRTLKRLKQNTMEYEPFPKN